MVNKSLGIFIFCIIAMAGLVAATDDLRVGRLDAKLTSGNDIIIVDGAIYGSDNINATEGYIDVYCRHDNGTTNITTLLAENIPYSWSYSSNGLQTSFYIRGNNTAHNCSKKDFAWVQLYDGNEYISRETVITKRHHHRTIIPDENAYCGDGIINQEIEDCDGLDGLDINQTCTETCSIAYGDNEVPEFGLLAGALAICGVIGIIAYRRK